MALVDPLGTADAPFGFGISRLLSVGLDLGKPPSPTLKDAWGIIFTMARSCGELLLGGFPFENAL